MRLTATKLYNMARTWPEFRAFVEATDQIAGREIVDNAFRYMFSPAGRTKVKINKAEIRRLTERFVDSLISEGYKALLNMNSIDALFARASRGQLRDGLQNRGNQDIPWLLNNATTQNEDIELALDWILKRSGTNKAKGAEYDYFEATEEEKAEAERVATQRVVAGLRNAMTDVIRNNRMNVCDLATLQYLHQHSGPLNATRRWFGTAGLEDQFYGGTAMGGALQRYVEGKVRQLSTLAQRNPAFWYDVACLQLTGFIIAHGFVDGNGRSARMMFACTQIQKGRQFIAPLLGWTNNQVTGQNVNQVIHANQQALDAYTDQLIDELI